MHRVQVLRFVAAAMVLFGHVQLKVRAQLVPVTFDTLGHAGFWAFGVDVFFVISGFIMYRVARDEFGQPQAAMQFFLRRVARIVPSYWLLTSAMTGSMLLLSQHVVHSEIATRNVIASYFFIPTLSAYGEPYPVLTLGWTLNFEMMFYVLFALALNFRRPLGLCFLVSALVSLGLLGVARPPATMPLAFWCNPIVFEFLFGVVIAYVHASGKRWTPIYAAFMLIVGTALLFLGSRHSAASPFWPWRALWMGVPAALLCAAAVLAHEAPKVSAAGRLFAQLGDGSYALYLTHPFSLAVILMLCRRFDLPASWSCVALACIGAVVVAVIFFRLFERGSVAWLQERIRPTRESFIEFPVHVST